MRLASLRFNLEKGANYGCKMVRQSAINNSDLLQRVQQQVLAAGGTAVIEKQSRYLLCACQQMWRCRSAK